MRAEAREKVMAETTATDCVGMVVSTRAYLESQPVWDTRVLLADLCRQFYNLGWVSGTGGSITIKVHDDAIPRNQQLILMSPSGVQKERMIPEDMYILSSSGSVLSSPAPKPFPHKHPKCSDCAPLFIKAYDMRDAGSVIHSHGMESCLATMINPTAKEFRITHMEMIKGIKGYGYHDDLVVPIIENAAHEGELTESLSKAIDEYPRTTAVLVRNHGIYVWGDSWISAKTQAECYHYLFEAAIRLRKLGLDWTTPQHGPIEGLSGGYRELYTGPSWRFIVLDVEGTTTPISFVSEVLFPYSSRNVGNHLSSTYDTVETQEDIRFLRSQIRDDLEQMIVGAVHVPQEDAGKENVIAAIASNVESMITSDRKSTALKQLQGHIWRTGFSKKELRGVVFEDVPGALRRWHISGVKVYIYSSGSRLAQRLLFANTTHGDLRKYLCGYFDTTIGNKKESRSYEYIAESVGADSPSEVLFVTDVYQEAVVAEAAGLEVVISIRPGNEKVPDGHGFRKIHSFCEI